ncbi:MAG TPA: hypothetical protein DHW82_12505 [Spirochaetia bacterium]|nr:MAG: hypothetical protein A2Y41_13340 [Spirochaetes bacterium GWB1_36_13]HCL57812.1 hypothetical protein [Spirochaetia bacterium]
MNENTLSYKRNFIFLAFSNFFFFAGNSFFHLLPLYLGKIGGSKTYIGVVMGLTTGLMVLLSWSLRNKIDFLDKKKFVIYSALLATLIYVGYFFTANLYTVFFWRMLQGVIYTIGFTFSAAILVEIIPKEKLVGLVAVFGISGALTNAFGPFVGEKIIKYASFKYIFLAAAVSSLLWLFFIFQVGYVKIKPKKQDSSSEAPISVYLKIIPTAILFGMVFSSFFSFISHYAEEYHIVPISAFYLSYTGILILIRLFFFDKMNSWNIHKTIRSSFFLVLLVLTGAYFLPRFSFPLFLGLIGAGYGMAHGFLYPTVSVLFLRQTPERRGKATIVFILLFNLGHSISSVFLGFTADHIGYPYMYLIAAAITVFGLVFFLKNEG